MPIIFASSILSLPQTISMFWQPESGSVGAHIQPIPHIVLYALLILAFAYFYYLGLSSILIQIANRPEEERRLHPGFRPWKPTSDFITKALGLPSLVRCSSLL